MKVVIIFEDVEGKDRVNVRTEGMKGKERTPAKELARLCYQYVSFWLKSFPFERMDNKQEML